MPNMISEDEVLQFLGQVEAGAVRLTPEDEPQAVYAGKVRYVASNGWSLVVFNDANEWDYTDSVETVDGRKLDFDALDAMPRVRLYTPTEDIAWTRSGHGLRLSRPLSSYSAVGARSPFSAFVSFGASLCPVGQIS
jgi:hypothetical protein